jgi:hypothetical protein
MKNILFISEYPLDQQSSGCLHFFDIVKSAASSHKVSHLHLEIFRNETNPFNDLISNKLPPLDTLNIDVSKIEPLNNINRYKVSVHSYTDLDHIYNDKKEAYIAQQIIRFRMHNLGNYLAKKFLTDFDILFIFLQESSTFFYAEYLCHKGLKVIPIYLDPVEMRNHIYNTNILSRSVINSSIKEIYNKAHGFVLPSELALKKISAFTKIKNFTYAYPIIRNQSKSNFKNDSVLIKEKKDINILMVGQIYALDELLKFINTLPMLRNKRNLKSINFTYIGKDDAKTLIKENIKYDPALENIIFIYEKPLGHLALIDRVKGKFDFGYVPYPFLEEMNEIVGFSFPSKFVAYIEAGILPIYHGPSGSVSNFLKKNELDYLCIHNQFEGDILKSLDSMISNDINLNTITNLQLLEKFFHGETLNINLTRLISEVTK